MATVIKPPEKTHPYGFSIFLAGSIEMGAAENWQVQVEKAMTDINVTIYNPRRDNWDPTWLQRDDNPVFKEQVDWELSNLEMADVIAMYFDPNTKAPITLLELGLFGQRNRTVVCCPEGFWRKGNVDIVCERYSILQVKSLYEMITYIKMISKPYHKVN